MNYMRDVRDPNHSESSELALRHIISVKKYIIFPVIIIHIAIFVQSINIFQINIISALEKPIHFLRITDPMLNKIITKT